MGNVTSRGKPDRLTRFQREKLKHEFFTFFDLNNDGCLTYKDFLWAKDKICYMSGWKIDSPKYKITEMLFNEIWESLEVIADLDKDGKITKTEWLMMWKTYKKEISEKEKEQKDFLRNYYRHSIRKHNGDSPDGSNKGESSAEADDKMNNANEDFQYNHEDDDDLPVQLDSDEEPTSFFARGANVIKVNKDEDFADDSDEQLEGRLAAMTNGDQQSGASAEDVKIDMEETDEEENYCKLPKWLYKYLVFRFNLLDRVGDGIIDHEEFEYVMSEFGVSERTARQCFNMFTINNTKELDFDYFVSLFEEYYLSDDPSDLGNFINGRLEFPVEESSDAETHDEQDIEDVDPGLVDHRAYSSTSLHSMDDDLHPNLDTDHSKKHTTQENGSETGPALMLKKVIKRCKNCSII